MTCRIEPVLTTVEREQLQKKVLPLLSTDTDAARAALEELTTPESSALLDFTLGNLYFQDERMETASYRRSACFRR